MAKETGILNYTTTYEADFPDEKNKLDVHINVMFIELNVLKNTISVFDIAHQEWERRFESGERIEYSAVRTILYEALPYKVFLGLGKILTSHKSEYSLLKTANVISQMDEFKNNSEVQQVVKEIQEYLSSSGMAKVISTYRDQFFAHLDKVSRFTDCRVDPAVAMKDIKREELDSVIGLVAKLSKVCFGEELEYSDNEICADDVIYTFFWR